MLRYSCQALNFDFCSIIYTLNLLIKLSKFAIGLFWLSWKSAVNLGPSFSSELANFEVILLNLFYLCASHFWNYRSLYPFSTLNFFEKASETFSTAATIIKLWISPFNSF